MNDLFNQLGGADPNFLKRFLQFKSTFTGDPKQMVQQMLNNGKMSQSQFNELANKATQLQKMFKL